MIDISVIVPTLNDPLIADVINALDRELEAVSMAASAEIIVVGRDEVGRLRDVTHPVRFIDTQQPVGAAAARNLGIRAAEGRWLLFVDADCLVQPGWLHSLMLHMTMGRPVVGGGVTTATDNYWPLTYNVSMFHEFLVGNTAGEKRYLPTLNLAVSREVVDEVGFMNETLPRGQDIDWTIRMALAGFPLYFEPGAAVLHCPQRSDLRALWSLWVKSGYYNVQNRLRYGKYYGTPAFMRSSFFLLALSPLIAGYVTLRSFWQRPWLMAYVHTLPAVLLTKLAWCVGAARAVKGGLDYAEARG